MTGRRSRDEGSRTERDIVRLLQAYAATKISGEPGADITMPLHGRDLDRELKCRANGCRQLSERDLLIAKAERREALVIVRMSLVAEIAKRAAA